MEPIKITKNILINKLTALFLTVVLSACANSTDTNKLNLGNAWVFSQPTQESSGKLSPESYSINSLIRLLDQDGHALAKTRFRLLAGDHNKLNEIANVQTDSNGEVNLENVFNPELVDNLKNNKQQLVIFIQKGDQEIKTSIKGIKYLDKKLEIEVIASIPVPKEVKTSISSLNIVAGKQAEVAASVEMSDGNDSTAVVWASADESVATVKDGIISGLKQGSAFITVSALADLSVNTKILVTVLDESKVARVNIVKPVDKSVITGPLSLGLNSNFQLEAINIFDDGTTSTNIIWKSSDETILTVGRNSGLLLGLKEGKVTVTATSTIDNRFSSTVEVFVKEDSTGTDTTVPGITVSSVSIQPASSTSLEVGKSLSLTATVKLSDNSNDNKGVTWLASNSNASISSNGIITGITPGNVIVTATSKKNTAKKATKTITITAVDDSITFDGKIVFTTSIDGQGIYLMTGNNKNIRKIISGETDKYVSLNKAGTKLVFSSKRHGSDNFLIYTANIDGSDLTQITFGDQLDFYPSWTPDGKIIFHSNRFGYTAIFIMNSDGSGVQKIVSEGVDGTISGDIITFERYGKEVWKINRDGSELVKLADGWAPRISSDGSKVVYFDSAGIKIMNTDGSEQTLIYPGQYVPVFSPDGSKILFHKDFDGDREIFIMNSDGSDLKQMTDNNVEDYASGTNSWIE